MYLVAGPPAKACDWMQGMLWPSSHQVLVSSLQHTSHLLQRTHTGCTPHDSIINPTRAPNKEIIATRMFRIATNAGKLGQHNRYSAENLGQHNWYSAGQLEQHNWYSAGELGQHNRYSARQLRQHNWYSARQLGQYNWYSDQATGWKIQDSNPGRGKR